VAFPRRVGEESSRRESLASHSSDGGAEESGTRGESVEPVPAAIRARRRSHEPRIRSLVRDHGAFAYCPGSIQLFGARYGKYGSAGSLWNPRTAAALAGSAARGTHPFSVRNDRARCRVE